MNFPISFKFKILAIAPQITVTNSEGQQIAYVRQKMLKFKESIQVFTDDKKSSEIAQIKADRVIDWSARYHFSSANGESPMGAVKRRGMKSLWKASYDIFPAGNDESPDMMIKEENPFAKVMDGILGDIPVVGLASGYLFHPKYLISSADGTQLARIQKHRSFFEATFSVEKLSDLTEDQAMRIVFSTIMMILLERNRG